MSVVSSLVQLDACRISPPSVDRWLGQCFVRPRIYDATLGAGSILVEAPAGHGKSTLQTMAQRDAGNKWLNVAFDPTSLRNQDSDTGSNRIYDYLFRCMTEAMWEVVSNNPQILADIGNRAVALKYFGATFAGENWVSYTLQSLIEDCPEHQMLLESFRDSPTVELFNDAATDGLKLDTLADCARRMGFAGVVVWIDLPDDEAITSTAISIVEEILDSLKATRRRDIYFKCFVGPTASRRLRGLQSVFKLSVEHIAFQWSQAELQRIADRRIHAATSGQWTTLLDAVGLDHLSQIPSLIAESTDHPGPIEWIKLTELILQQVAKKSEGATLLALDATDWLEARKAYYAERIKLSFNSDGVLRRGARLIESIAPSKRSLHPIIKYLYEHPGIHETHTLADKLGWDEQSLATYIHRIRKEIEPLWSESSGKVSIYLVNESGGYGLINTKREQTQP
jgi:hypothetical protein